MYLFLIVIAIIICALLVLMVLIQNPKGGGLSSNFSSSSQLMGVQKTGDFLEKGTWVLAIALMVLSMAINIAVKGGTQQTSDPYKEQKDKVNKAAPHTAAPVAPFGSSSGTPKQSAPGKP